MTCAKTPHSTAIGPAQLAKFVRPGPRYTSYPPATEFRPDIAGREALGQLAELGRRPAVRSLSLYCHVPFCASLCWYCGCNVVATRNRDSGTRYIDDLIAELDLVAQALGRRLALAELSLGGGSPNFLVPADLARLVEAVHDRFPGRDDIERGIELDPRDTELAHVGALAASGFSRVSIGVQDFAPAVQKAIHRQQSVSQTASLVGAVRRAGIERVNIDLVYGLPGQSPATLAHTLDAVLGFAPDRIALFGYAHLPHLRPHQRLVERAHPVPTVEQRAALLAVALERLADAGYVRIGLDHFARPDDSLATAAATGTLARNFQGYVVRRGDALLGCGASAISDSGTAYWQNHVDVAAWQRSIRAGALPAGRGVILDADDQLRRWIIMRLMCHSRVDFAEIEREFSVRCEEYFAAELTQLGQQPHRELADIDRGRRELVATELGTKLIRNLCMVFDRYQQCPADSGPPRFSPTL
jgi:oxygen-independent coproporphyrinogen III oxidase